LPKVAMSGLIGSSKVGETQDGIPPADSSSQR
jgi:hypothetical protein